MAESAINRRKSQLFLNNISPVTDTYNELIKKKLKRGKFLETKTGIIKIAGMLILIFAVTFFEVQPLCDDTSNWYPYLFPISASLNIIVQLIFVFIFSMGFTVSKPSIWIYSDMVVILVLSATTIITSTVTLINCQGSNVDKVSQSCGMAGGVTLFVSCGAIFLMFRYVEDEDLPENKKRKPNENTGIDPRKSVFA
ncbi:uncharacterized protein [Diabrotica undecimpunctata]|uniref:uncharacterized protein isoform X1 n=1 Tax=Diabrotica undecimpunctata TaxID=50387 RepID=UPI003B63ECEF